MRDDLTEEYPLWLLPDKQKRSSRPGLYLVATPIGNLQDISIRALNTLAVADVVFCEDTRVTGKLLQAYGLKKKTNVYNDHSTGKTRGHIISLIQSGQTVALVSDAGLPLVSDPGYKLVQSCMEQKLYVTSIPGANAALTAVQLSGFPSDSFTFIGFLPNKSKARQDTLRQWQAAQTTLMAYETAPRLLKALEDINSIMPARQMAVARELTKMYEETRRGTAADLIAFYTQNGTPKGEIVLVIAPPSQAEFSEGDLDAALKAALKTMNTKEAAAHVAQQSGLPRKTLYDMALKLK